MKRLNFIPKPDVLSFIFNVPSLPYNFISLWSMSGLQNTPFSIDWGDGSTTQHTQKTADEWYSHTYYTTGDKYITIRKNIAKLTKFFISSTDIRFDVRNVPPNITQLVLMSTYNMYGNLDFLPRSLTFLQINGGHYTGNLDNLPPLLTRCDLTNCGGTFTGSLEHLPPNLTMLNLSLTGYSFISSIENLPDTLTTLQLSSTPGLSGDISLLPPNLEYIDFFGASDLIVGDIANLPSSVYYFRIHVTNGIGGDIANLPPNMVYLSLYNNPNFYGSTEYIFSTSITTIIFQYMNNIMCDIALLPPSLHEFYAWNSPNIFGNIPDMPVNLTKISIITGGAGFTFIGSYPSWSGLSSTAFNSANLDTTTVDAILADCAATSISNYYLDLGGASNDAPGTQGLLDKATLISRGWSVNTN